MGCKIGFIYLRTRIQPYYDKADRHLVDNFKKVINYEYQLSDPDNPSKAQELILNRYTPKTKQELVTAISDYIYGLVSNKQINDREGVLMVLESKGILLTKLNNEHQKMSEQFQRMSRLYNEKR